MAPVEVRRTVPTPLDAVWDTLTDFAAYGRWIPLTSMRTDPGPARLGWAFGGFTGLGPVGFLDSMLVVKWEPPLGREARFAVRKTGRVLRGWADVHLASTGAGGTDVAWREEIVPRPETIGRLVAPVADRVTARLFADALDGMLAAAETRATSS